MSKENFFYLPLNATKKDWLLNNGTVFPKITFGVTEIHGYDNIYNTVNHALTYGYRSFDCSPLNGTEEYLGRTLDELLPLHSLERKDVMISSKILPKDYGVENAEEAVRQSCENLKTDYIDLFLMGWPGGHNLNPECEQNQHLRTETWNEIARLNSEGVIKTAGVCHFTCKHLESIRLSSNKIPAVNQVEFHPKCPQLELLWYCSENNIQLQAASYRETFNPLLLNEVAVRSVARRLNKTPTQVLLKWIISRGVGVIPQSEKPAKIERSFKLFDFSLERPEMDAISAIEAREKYLINSICVH